jgi:hypothetical protein
LGQYSSCDRHLLKCAKRPGKLSTSGEDLPLKLAKGRLLAQFSGPLSESDSQDVDFQYVAFVTGYNSFATGQLSPPPR